MTACASYLPSHIDALRERVPWGLHPACDREMSDLFAKMSLHINDAACVHKLMGKVILVAARELVYAAENYEALRKPNPEQLEKAKQYRQEAAQLLTAISPTNAYWRQHREQILAEVLNP